MKFRQTTKSFIVDNNKVIKQEHYSSIQLTNLGTCQATVNDNIPLEPGAVWALSNEPYVEIAEDTLVRFTGVEVDKRILVEQVFNKEVK